MRNIATIQQIFLAFFVFCSEIQNFLGQIPSKPIINSILQISKRSVSISWTVGSGKNGLTRYVIELNEDGSNIKEWPVQMNQVNYTILSTDQFTTTATSYFDCKNKCLNNSKCTFSVSSYSKQSSRTIDCVLKYNNSGIQLVPKTDDEYSSLKMYEDLDVVINDLPYNHLYKFRVKVFNASSNEWSQFSDWSNDVDMRINLDLSVTRTSYKKLKLQWKQANIYTGSNYIISKYVVVVHRGSTVVKRESINDPSLIEKVLFGPNYDSLNFFTDFLQTSVNESTCYLKCIEEEECVYAVHFTKAYGTPFIRVNDCFKKPQLDLYSGGLSRDGSTVYGLKNNANEFEFSNDVFNVEYKVKLEYLTPFSSKSVSNEVTYNLTDLQPYIDVDVENYSLESIVKWKFDEIPISKVQVLQADNLNGLFQPYFTESKLDYNGILGNPLNVDIYQCYKACFENIRCVSIAWKNESSIVNRQCLLRYDSGTVTSCPNNTKCVMMLGASSEVTVKDQLLNRDYCYKAQVRTTDDHSSPYSNTSCIRFNFSITLEMLENTFTEGNSLTLSCKHTDVNETIIQVTWYKDESPIDFSTLNAEVTSETNFEKVLKLNNLNHSKHDGNYSCKALIKNRQVINSNSVELNVHYVGEVLFDKGDSIILINESDPINVTCSAEGIPLRSIQLLFNNSQIANELISQSNDERFTYVTFKLENAQRSENNGELVCIDEENNIKKAIKLTVRAKPSKPRIVKATTNEIEWSLDDDGGFSISKILLEWSSDFSSGIDGSYSVNNPQYKVKLNDKLPGQKYLKITAINDLGNSKSSDEMLITKTSPNYGLIFGTVGGSIAVIALIVVFVVYRIRRKPKQNIPQFDPIDPTVHTYESHTYDSNESPFPRSVKKAVTKGNISNKNDDTRHSLYEYWQQNFETIDEIITTEYNKLRNPNEDEFPMNEAIKKCNFKKSKFKSIYPFDYNRVKLSPIAEVEGSDFINASYIQIDGNQKYIAAQAPTRNTLNDFYRMIHEQNVKVIVMLTPTFPNENDNLNFPYWNDETVFECSNFRLSLINLENQSSYVKRIFKLTDENHPEYQQTIAHYHYIKWPDKSVPDETYSLVELINCVNKHERNDWPILVHCNTCVGRTGTYIVLDSLFNMVKEKKELTLSTITDCMNTMRRQRVHFVQTMVQYKFIVQALLESYVFGYTRVEIQNCVETATKLKENKQLLLETEYNNLSAFKDKLRTTTYFEKNRAKFVSEKFKPYDEALILLEKTNPNDELSRFVDAVYCQTSETPMKYIIASDPIENYLEDIARITLEKRPAIIVSLSRSSYLPQLYKEKKIGDNYVVKNNQVSSVNGITYFGLTFKKISDNVDGSNVFYIEQIQNWKENNIPKNRELFVKFIDCVLDIAEQYRMNNNSNDGPLVLVHSTFTGDRCAEFVACCVIMYTMRTYKWMNVFQTVYWLRKHRENMISELANYEFLYVFACEVSRYKKLEAPMPKKRLGKEAKNRDDDNNNKKDETAI